MRFHGKALQPLTSAAIASKRVGAWRLASLEMWPDSPHFDICYTPWRGAGEVNCVGRFVLGLFHDDDHLGQIAEIVRQAHQARQSSARAV
jgi:hypothetical protein